MPKPDPDQSEPVLSKNAGVDDDMIPGKPKYLNHYKQILVLPDKGFLLVKITLK